MELSEAVRATVEKMAEFRARNGERFEAMIKQKHRGDPKFAFLFDAASAAHQYYQERVRELQKRLPVTILTGFLGAGKTTLLNKLLSSAAHRMKFAVIENEVRRPMQRRDHPSVLHVQALCSAPFSSLALVSLGHARRPNVPLRTRVPSSAAGSPTRRPQLARTDAGALRRCSSARWAWTKTSWSRRARSRSSR